MNKLVYFPLCHQQGSWFVGRSCTELHKMAQSFVATPRRKRGKEAPGKGEKLEHKDSQSCHWTEENEAEEESRLASVQQHTHTPLMRRNI